MAISIGMNIINIALGFTLVRGLDLGFVIIPSLGVSGAGFALAASRMIGLAAAFFFTRKAKVMRLGRLRFFKPSFPMQKTILNYVRQTAWNRSNTAFQPITGLGEDLCFCPG